MNSPIIRGVTYAPGLRKRVFGSGHALTGFYLYPIRPNPPQLTGSPGRALYNPRGRPLLPNRGRYITLFQAPPQMYQWYPPMYEPLSTR